MVNTNAVREQFIGHPLHRPASTRSLLLSCLPPFTLNDLTHKLQIPLQTPLKQSKNKNNCRNLFHPIMQSSQDSLLSLSQTSMSSFRSIPHQSQTKPTIDSLLSLSSSSMSSSQDYCPDDVSFALPTDVIDSDDDDNDDDGLSLENSNHSSILSFNIDDFIETTTNNHITSSSVVSLCSLSYSDDETEAEDYNSEDEYNDHKDQNKYQYQEEDKTTNFYNNKVKNRNGLARIDKNKVDLVELEVKQMTKKYRFGMIVDPLDLIKSKKYIVQHRIGQEQ